MANLSTQEFNIQIAMLNNENNKRFNRKYPIYIYVLLETNRLMILIPLILIINRNHKMFPKGWGIKSI